MKLKSTEYGKHQLLNPEFVYIPAARTDISKTFAKARRALEHERRDAEERDRKVRALKVKP